MGPIQNSNEDNPAQSVRPPPRRLTPSNSLGNEAGGGGGGFSNAARPIWSTGPIVNTRVPERRPQRPPQRRPQQQFVPEARPVGPSQCVWAIVNCCASNSLAVRYECFERLGCNGAFWDLNPCSDFVLNAALDESDLYFQ